MTPQGKRANERYYAAGGQDSVQAIRHRFEVFWAARHELKEIDKEKIALVLDSIPDDVATIIDVGCGDGAVTNALPGRCRVFATDFSAEGLRHVRRLKVQSMLPMLPFQDRSADLVLCCDVIEHLPKPIYRLALHEIDRLARKYILLTLPYKQTLSEANTKCRVCGCVWQADTHLRSYSDRNINSLVRFFSAEVIRRVEFGPQSNRYYALMCFLKQRVFGVYPQLGPAVSTCPQCGTPTGVGGGLGVEGEQAVPKSNPFVVLLRPCWKRLALDARWPFKHRYEVLLLLARR